MRFSSWRIGCLWLVVWTFAACGKKTPAHNTAAPTAEPAAAVDNATTDDVVESPESLDAINTTLDRKRSIAARCLSEAIDKKELPKNARGRMTLGFTIAPNGRAVTIKVINQSLESTSLTQCVTEIVERAQFPELKKAREWTYTFAFEAT